MNLPDKSLNNLIFSSIIPLKALPHQLNILPHRRRGLIPFNLPLERSESQLIQIGELPRFRLQRLYLF